MLQRQHQFAGGGDAGNHGNAAFFSGFGKVDVEARADGEYRAGVFYRFELLAVDHGAGADNRAFHFFFDQLNGFDAVLGTQGDLEGGDTAFYQGVRQINSGVDVVNRYYRHYGAGA